MQFVAYFLLNSFYLFTQFIIFEALNIDKQTVQLSYEGIKWPKVPYTKSKQIPIKTKRLIFLLTFVPNTLFDALLIFIFLYFVTLFSFTNLIDTVLQFHITKF